VAVFEVLLAQVLWNVPPLTHGSDIEFRATPRGEFSIRTEGRYSSEDGFFWVFELNE
jgi:hypothetical protein